MTDNNAGHGGSYIIDKSGNRVLVSRTSEIVVSEQAEGYSKKEDGKPPAKGVKKNDKAYT